MKTFTALFLTLAAVSAATAQETLSWDTAVSRLSEHQSVVLASASLRIAGSDLAAEEAWKGLRVSVQPVAEYEDPDGTPALSEVSFGADLLFPLGITAAEREKKSLLSDSFVLRQKEAESAYGAAFLDLYRRYAGAYIAQEAVRTAEADFELETVRIQAVAQRVQQGLLPVSAALEAEDDHQDAEAALTQSRLDLRLAWFDLAYSANIEPVRSDHEKGSQNPLGLVPRLDNPDLADKFKPVAQPLQLIALAKQNSPTVIVQKMHIAEAERALSASSFAEFSIAPKVDYGMTDSSFSLGFNSSTGSISLGGDWTAFKEASSVPSSQTVTNTIALSVLVSADLDGGGSARRDSLTERLVLERRKLAYTEAAAELVVRSRYAAYLKALDSSAETARALESARSLAVSLEAKKKIGQTSPEDEAASRAMDVKYAYNAERSRILLSLAYLELMDAACAWETTGLLVRGIK